MKSKTLEADIALIKTCGSYGGYIAAQYRRMAVALDEIRSRAEDNGWMFTCKQCHKALKRFEEGGK